MMSMNFSQRKSVYIQPEITELDQEFGFDSDESPFEQSEYGMTTMYVESFLNTYTKEYQSIITLSNTSIGPVSRLVHRMRRSHLSEFNMKNRRDFDINNQCMLALCRFPVNSRNFSIKRDDAFMTEDDIGSVFSYLQSRGYIIETQLTKITNKFGGNAHDSRRVVCVFTYGKPTSLSQS